MKHWLSLPPLLAALLVAGCSHLIGNTRFGVREDRRCPHSTPEELLSSTLSQMEEGQWEYVVAHLMSPRRVPTQELYQEVLAQFKQSPAENWRDVLLNLRAVSRGEIEPRQDNGTLRYHFNNAGGDIVILEIDDRWYIDNI